MQEEDTQNENVGLDLDKFTGPWDSEFGDVAMSNPVRFSCVFYTTMHNLRSTRRLKPVALVQQPEYAHEWVVIM